MQKDEFTPKAVDALRGRMPVDKESPVSLSWASFTISLGSVVADMVFNFHSVPVTHAAKSYSNNPALTVGRRHALRMYDICTAGFLEQYLLLCDCSACLQASDWNILLQCRLPVERLLASAQ